MQYHAQVVVTLRPAVLDPAGTAVQKALQAMHHQVGDVRIGKYIEITVTAESETEATTQLEKICCEVLSNPVVEAYRWQITATATQ